MRQTFEEWMKEVGKEMWALVGCFPDDLPDWKYYDAYEDRVSPPVAAKRAIKAAGGC